MSKVSKYTSCVCLSIFIQQWILHWVYMAIESLLALGCIYLLKKKIGNRFPMILPIHRLKEKKFFGIYVLSTPL